MHSLRRRPYRTLGAALAAVALLVGAAQINSSRASAGAEAPSAAPPPAHAGFDYQIGGAYEPPDGVRIVTRDHTDRPADGLYNICYVNAFQAQPGAEDSWDPDLLLRNEAGEVVYDEDWHEAFLDLRTADKRRRVAAKVGRWIDSCASQGYDAVEPDNYDSYDRSGKLLTATQAQQYIRLLSEQAHRRGLAIGQKNTPQLAGEREANGLDFAVAEECGEYEECDAYTRAFGDRVVVIEYRSAGLRKACDGWGDRLSIVRRDLGVTTPGDEAYVRQTC
ncbi:endo alpha-1,4 polygalactosaminidase [Streptomyces boncukensis]|uniref:Endo alpha-1,4 polygalactosaminidase n=1 Tax=Streptomyces boncukensis TaxID=2711219 RepID=A0A6G4X921_9ACTN|nr:endo alpha-1,4 polygalactosaminidase [Streptomyces boncukensis]NGO73743.1 endo alpha-1,4 polygalactosaminidase [Streptomyces boncukensis]